MFSATLSLIKKELLLEWRNKYAISGIFMYMLSIILIIFFTFESVQPAVWVVLFWIIILFTAVNAVAKSFLSESSGRNLYLYTLASPQSIILSKIIYNVSIMLFLSFIAVLFYSFSAGFPVQDNVSFFIVSFLGAVSFASVFSMMSAIASKANNSGTLMAILSFPVLIPILKILIRISLNAVSANEFSANLQDIFYLLALDILIITLALILFPYLWRD
jgi:heme exporter protein B